MRRTSCVIGVSFAFALAAGLGCATANAGDSLLYSWEGSLEDWTAANATLVNSSFGATDGAQAMLMDNLGGGFRNDVGVATVNSGSAYDAWSQAGNRIAAGDLDVALEFDFTFDHSLSNVQTGQFVFAQLAIFVNSTGAGFRQYGTGSFIGGNIDVDFPTLAPAAIADGVTMTGTGNTRHIRIPMGALQAMDGSGLNVGPPSAGSFYQVGFKSNGGWTGTVDWAIDNMFVSGANIPEPASMTLIGMGLAACLPGLRRRR